MLLQRSVIVMRRTRKKFIYTRAKKENALSGENYFLFKCEKVVATACKKM
jgi:hypothetical protein